MYIYSCSSKRHIIISNHNLTEQKFTVFTFSLKTQLFLETKIGTYRFQSTNNVSECKTVSKTEIYLIKPRFDNQYSFDLGVVQKLRGPNFDLF